MFKNQNHQLKSYFLKIVFTCHSKIDPLIFLILILIKKFPILSFYLNQFNLTTISYLFRGSLRFGNRLRAFATAISGVPDNGTIWRRAGSRLPLRSVSRRHISLLRARDSHFQFGSRESVAAGADRLRFAERHLHNAKLLMDP